MIAQAWARRRYKAVFVSKLDEALGEATETQSWLDDARDAEYLSAPEFDALDAQYCFDHSNAFANDRPSRRFL
jgi:four helix bundle protein